MEGQIPRNCGLIARHTPLACATVLRTFPNDILALQLYTHVLGWLGGKPDAAAPLAGRLVDVDPLNAMSLLVSAMVPLFAGRFSEAVEPARRMFALDPVTPVWRANYVMALSYNQLLDEAEEFQTAPTVLPYSQEPGRRLADYSSLACIS